MAISDYLLEDQTAEEFRAELNDALEAIATNNANSSVPPETFPHMWWYDTTNHILKMRNLDNNDWIDIAYFNHAVTPSEVTLLANFAGTDLLNSIVQEITTNNTTDDFTEGTTNLFYTDARARSAISVSGDISYDASTGIISVTTYDTSDFNTDLASKTTDNLTEGSTNKYFSDERVDDRVNALVQQGTGINVSYNDTANSLTIEHSDTSNASSVSNTVIQGITVDGFGHITNIDTTDLDTFKQSLMPAGAIIMWSGSVATIPTGWVLCNGQNNTPNLMDRFVVGAGQTYNVGDTGGANTVTLTTSQMPNHTHDGSGLTAGPGGGHNHGAGTLRTDQAGNHRHEIYGNNRGTHGGQLYAPGLWKDDAERLASDWQDTIRPAGAHSHDITGVTGYEPDHSHHFSGTTGSTGGGTGHENRPPYYALCYIMKT